MIKINFRKISVVNAFFMVVMMSCFAAGTIILLDKPEQAEAGRVWLLGVNIHNPKPPSVKSYQPNELIEFRSELQFKYCSNEWYAASGQISEPVLKGRAHKRFGPLTKNDSQRQIVNKKDLVWKGGHSVIGGGHKTFSSRYNQNFRAPKEPGTYWFRYRIVVTNGENTGNTREGTVVFKVQGADLLPQSRNLICEASKTNLKVGESVTYTARRAEGGSANFNWYNGSSATGNILKTQNSVTQSTYSTSYSTEGMYQVSVLVSVPGGTPEKCVMGVTVGDIDDLPDDDENDPDLPPGTYTMEDGTVVSFEPNSPPGKVTMSLAGSITNITCKAEWEGEHVFECRLYKNNQVLKSVPIKGTEDFGYGTYQIGCNQKRDGKEIKSTPVTCRQNPDFREL